jgi:SOS-response transcriptional repressor LexA
LKRPLNEQQREFASLMKVKGWSQAETARRLDMSDAAVSQILSGKNTPSAQTLHLMRRMVLEEGSEEEPMGVRETSNAVEVLAPSFRKSEKAPVVSWASAGNGATYSDLAKFLDEYVETDCRDPNKYALIVEGDSMEPVFRAGDRIVVAPNVLPHNGDVVVARVAETGEVFFKLYHETSSGKVQLTSYNPAYPPIHRDKKEFRFIHPVYSMTRQTLKRGGRK